jgi:hypothetical protein
LRKTAEARGFQKPMPSSSSQNDTRTLTHIAQLEAPVRDRRSDRRCPRCRPTV